jgi:lysozyme
MKTSQQGVNLIKKFEGCRLEAYLCPASVPTIGYGHTRGVTMGQKITQKQAEEFLCADLATFEAQVERMAPNLSQGQFDALVSFAYNLGATALCRLYQSILFKGHLKCDFDDVIEEFGKWVFAERKILPGLVARRRAEAELFAGNVG